MITVELLQSLVSGEEERRQQLIDDRRLHDCSLHDCAHCAITDELIHDSDVKLDVYRMLIGMAK